MFRIPDTAQVLTSRRTGVAVAACLAMTALVAGCGGGDRVKPFQPSQIIAFGDETSAFDDTATASSNRLVDFGVAGVPYAARYTINVVADGSVAYCKTAAPDSLVSPACTSPSQELATADIPTSAYFFLPQSSVYGYRVTSGIPVVNEVTTGTFNDNATGAVTSAPNPIYRAADHIYSCSTNSADASSGNWVQRLALSLGGTALSLGSSTAGCPQETGNGRSYAAWGAKVDDVSVQVNAHLGELRDGVLVTMLAGQNDIMAAYDSVRSNATDADSAKKLMRDKGVQLAHVINTVVATGARVVYLTVPDMGSSPKAMAGDAALAAALTRAFNEGYKGNGESNESGGLVLSVLNNGHKIVKVDGYSLIATLAPSYPTSAVCQGDPAKVKMPNGTTLLTAFPTINASGNESLKAKALLLNCRSNNLIVTSGDFTASPPTQEVRADYLAYLWADDQRLAPLGHGSLANLAAARVRDQL